MSGGHGAISDVAIQRGRHVSHAHVTGEGIQHGGTSSGPHFGAALGFALPVPFTVTLEYDTVPLHLAPDLLHS